ncbi:tryptophan 7-halogenase [Flavobacterium psychrophilum]|uniref:Dehydrogenase/oxidoreductase n=2 Tax=Flavobacterium psychrophilum TaxID=96345 RepID=A6H1X0_FLAPJ|nr:NAD(P)/FAD-dependent oxidoreductase [Flavobacterium psychrophilum]AIG31014.1 pyridine nucleotide-disulfide oxidoreductase [Flavobacterium psychrophilum]AIG33291.1 pyridine nucleotide-disulfide oxidoreductase [Flavobacterium psychrophilum]AIG35440.1 pyridine nucleotide-disulfide oxidoreductase [Flavobacterium psychrophilum]AIG37801.1 pyridine nucleotide-disulfide oxidoreductase [Flavobacterium psychrophilum]AIG40072.1 pyridine nucleotide-disulfide oxidoreductase [Flavobacterium psychrophilum
MLKEFVDVLVIGAGPSGCVSASHLHNNNIKVKVVEKTKFPRIVVGESLIPRVMDHFAEAGLLESLEAMNFEKKLGARFIRGQEICVFDFSNKYGEGWDWTWQVPRADFDNTMAQEVIRKGIDLEFESEVISVAFEGKNSITVVKDKKGVEKEIHAKFIIDSSGYGRVLPRLLDLDTPSKLDPHSAIFTHVVDINRPQGEEGTLISFDILETEVWLWVIPFSNGNTSLGVVGPTHFINSLSQDNNKIEALNNAIKMSDYYINRFGGVEFAFEPVKLENYSRSVKSMYGDGFALTGNSSEFLDPVFSSGVAFATESGMLAAKLFIKETQGITVNWETEFTEYMRRGINVFTTYVKEWYTGNLQTLFFHQPENPDVKRKICAVLAGYVWDQTNPFVKKHDNLIKNMAHIINSEKEMTEKI